MNTAPTDDPAIQSLVGRIAKSSEEIVTMSLAELSQLRAMLLASRRAA